VQFIIDESTGSAVVECVRHAGHDVIAVADILPQANDPAILTLASTQKRILITNDKDFGELVYRSGHQHHGVLLLRLHDESSKNRVRVVSATLNQCGERLVGNFTVATDSAIRIRPRIDLP